MTGEKSRRSADYDEIGILQKVASVADYQL
jgi:hypothetical protein